MSAECDKDRTAAVLDDETVRCAAQFATDDLRVLFNEMAPMIRRMSRALCGSEAAGDRVVAHVLERSVQSLDRFRGVAQAQNWFSHHTVLASRQLARQQGFSSDDVLSRGGGPAMKAFIAALRRLPFQQREAFILTHGQRYDARQMAVSMDCSITAAANHLVAATAALRSLNPEEFTQHLRDMGENYSAMPANEEVAIPRVLKRVARRRIGRLILKVSVIALLFALALLIWRLVPMIVI